MESNSQCKNCKNPIEETDHICSNCKYPLKGTEKEKSIFIGQQILKKDTIKTAQNYRNFSKLILIGLGLFMIIPELIKLLNGLGSVLELIIGILIGGIFIISGFLTSKYPIGSVVTGIITIFITDVILVYVIFNSFYSGQSDPMDIIEWFVKEAFKIGLLVYALYKTVEEKKIKEEHLNLNMR